MTKAAACIHNCVITNQNKHKLAMVYNEEEPNTSLT